MTNQEAKVCRNCGTPLEGPVCHQCGQPTLADRWTTAAISRQVLRSIIDLERGFFHTIRQLFAQPAQVIGDFWQGKTVCYTEPFRYVLIWSAAALLVNFWLGIDDILQATLQPGSLEQTVDPSRAQAADQRFDNWLNLLGLAVIPINSLSSFLLFKRHTRTYGEHLILNAYTTGQLSLVSCFTQTGVFLLPSLAIGYLAFSLALGIAYNALVMAALFGEGWPRTLTKATIQGIIGVTAFFTLVAAAASLALRLS